jgi:hypothetical protein
MGGDLEGWVFFDGGSLSFKSAENLYTFAVLRELAFTEYDRVE